MRVAEWEIEFFDYGPEGRGWVTAELFEGSAREAMRRLKALRRSHRDQYYAAYRLVWRP